MPGVAPLGSVNNHGTPRSYLRRNTPVRCFGAFPASFAVLRLWGGGRESDVIQASPSHTVMSALCTRFWVKMPLGLAYVAATIRIFSVRPRPKEGKIKESSGGCRFLSLCHTTNGACRRCLSTGREELCTHSTQSSTGHVHCQGALGATGWRT